MDGKVEAKHFERGYKLEKAICEFIVYSVLVVAAHDISLCFYVF